MSKLYAQYRYMHELLCCVVSICALLWTPIMPAGHQCASISTTSHLCRHVRTLVVDLDNLLIHSDWTRGRGWRTFKRPGVEDFLKEMAQLYEIVVYTQALPTYADPILDRLDPSRYIVYRLYRDSTLYQHGHHVRDLSKLNRDMRKVLFITSDAKACQLHPSNSVVVRH